MKIRLDDVVVSEISSLQQQILQHDINADELVGDLARRLQYIITHKIEQCQERLLAEWRPMLAAQHESLPTNEDALCQMIFALPQYKCKKGREGEATNTAGY